ncbi:protein-disulfide isomerase [Pullulanibacillus pueri]|uniref:Disulfide bond formation protein D n=1 Tax=Pullulanibacillus pueri TaxID=1437324 RepID=A0A8J2ZWV2_9BACL|nr:DsbA family protein [Pullulanibacillus pueri]MBM7682628.1 protein-disulfide isomerase [Pullulanibacillus pueri]GGH82569.1 disulfide bond formation protein D [Pullulanibacillus pueri]
MVAKKKRKKTNKRNVKKQKARGYIYGAIGLFVIALAVVIIVGNVQKTEAAFDYKGQPYLGDKRAPVKIVEFGDYKCPYCKNFNETAFPEIEKDLVDTGKASFYFLNDPFIYTDSTRSALFAETVYHALGNQIFWKFHDQLYGKQPADSKYEQMDVYTNDFLQKTLQEVTSQAKVDKVMKAFKAKKYENDLKKDQSYVSKLGIQGTPAFFINGKEFKGTTYDDLIEMVNKAAKTD